ncbi:tetrahydromethanopterin S-methyltransferase subunit E [Edaphobacter lichenicola]|uniref:Tetrahydromethanopterin S-methyltransferase subunit E n=1 Tax=Tunturiibacter gelidiferens TaxID=3069689 RepID=A0ACC5NZD0_9BACT|nr:tetrahydromethanopterin S-methyltransferase subunit E [Edaphobacter lichenicola]
MVIRIVLSGVVAGATFAGTFVIFNIAYLRWAVWRYPQHNSMAGMTAFLYGLPVAVAFAALGFAIAFRSGSRSKAN